MSPAPPPPALRHVVGAAVLYPDHEQGCRVLAARRGPGMSGAGLWEFPGGKVEPGETEQEALRRELVEELGLEVAPLRRLGEVERPERSLRLAVWICAAAGEPILREHDATQLVAAGDLDGIGWSEPDRPFLPGLRAEMTAQARRQG